jgi:O-antigen/teichoic acid export membrane protein
MTNRLDPVDYGVFALAGPISVVFGVLPTLGSSVAMAKGFHRETLERRRIFISSYMLLLSIIGVVVAALFGVLWGNITHLLSYESVQLTPVALVCLGVSIFSSGWAVVMSEALSLDGKAKQFAMVSVGRDVTGALVPVAALYAFDLGPQSLFLGLGAAAVMDVLSAVLVLHPYLRRRLSWRCIKSVLGEFHVTAVQILDSIAKSTERVLISRYVGLDALGIISHSQAYETVSYAFVKSLARSVWPENLDEARDPLSKFPGTRLATDVISVVSLCGATFLGTIGYDVIGLLTHGKFNQAAYFAATWVAIFSLTGTSLGPKAVAVASGRAYLISFSMLAGRVVSLLALLLLVEWLQEAAVAVAAILAAIALKTVMYLGVLRFRKIPFQDGRAVLCALMGFAVILISVYWAHDLRSRMILFVSCGLLITYFNRDIVRMLMQRLSFA